MLFAVQAGLALCFAESYRRTPGMPQGAQTVFLAFYRNDFLHGVLPMADLAIACPFLVAACLPYCKKNIFRGFLSGIIVFVIALYVCTATADSYTAVAAMNGMAFESTSTSLGGSSTWVSWLVSLVFGIFG